MPKETSKLLALYAEFSALQKLLDNILRDEKIVEENLFTRKEINKGIENALRDSLVRSLYKALLCPLFYENISFLYS